LVFDYGPPLYTKPGVEDSDAQDADVGCAEVDRCAANYIGMAMAVASIRPQQTSGHGILSERVRIPMATEREGHMKRAILVALMLLAVLTPLTEVAHADLKSDQTIPQA